MLLAVLGALRAYYLQHTTLKRSAGGGLKGSSPSWLRSVESGVEVGDIVKVMDLRENMDNVNVRVRVLEAGESKVIETRNGPRTISEALVGDESGRVRLTLWGKLAGTLKKGDTVEIRNAWTTTYRGQVQLNVGARGSIVKIPSESVASEEEIAEETPKPRTPQPQRPRTGPREEGGPQRRFKPRR